MLGPHPPTEPADTGSVDLAMIDPASSLASRPGALTPRPMSGGLRPGLLPVHHLRGVLERSSEAAAPEARGRFLILTHRGPDPDALGACEGLRRLIGTGFGYESTVATLGRIHRAENLALVRALELDLVDSQTIDVTRFAGVTLVDTQPEFGHTVTPAAPGLLAVFDHHVPPPAKGERPRVPHRDVRLDLGATSSMIYEYLRDAGLQLDERTATALFCGVRYDTADLSRNVSTLDEEAYFETFRRADREMIARIDHPPLPRSYYRTLHRALSQARQHGALVVALLGNVDNPESIAEMADFFLRMKGVCWVVVGGAFENEYVLSLRTDYAFGKAYPLMERVLGGLGAFGGHGNIAGGRVFLEDQGESTIKSVERQLRANALAVVSPKSEDEEAIPPEGRLLTE